MKKKLIILVILIPVIGFGLWFFTIRDNPLTDYPQPPESKPWDNIYPEVWSQKSPLGESYEFKVNCAGIYDKLEECFLWELTAVKVTSPDGVQYELEKDFNVNDYSGEVTRRWVLYGPEQAVLPESGTYLFEYLKSGEVIFSQNVGYTQSKINYPTNVRWERSGGDLYVSWIPPEGVKSNMWYKVILWNESGTPDLFISDQFDWNDDEALMKDVPLIENDEYSVNVAIYFPDGYAYSEYIPVIW